VLRVPDAEIGLFTRAGETFPGASLLPDLQLWNIPSRQVMARSPILIFDIVMFFRKINAAK
jgi:hypothetical protein